MPSSRPFRLPWSQPLTSRVPAARRLIDARGLDHLGDLRGHLGRLSETGEPFETGCLNGRRQQFRSERDILMRPFHHRVARDRLSGAVYARSDLGESLASFGRGAQLETDGRHHRLHEHEVALAVIGIEWVVVGAIELAVVHRLVEVLDEGLLWGREADGVVRGVAAVVQHDREMHSQHGGVFALLLRRLGGGLGRFGFLAMKHSRHGLVAHGGMHCRRCPLAVVVLIVVASTGPSSNRGEWSDRRFCLGHVRPRRRRVQRAGRLSGSRTSVAPGASRSLLTMNPAFGPVRLGSGVCVDVQPFDEEIGDLVGRHALVLGHLAHGLAA